jgi:protein-tyrosine-phosphatase
MDDETVLFLCPHGAAKSVLAAALCRRMAPAHGRALLAVCAGTEPDPEIAPHVRRLLSEEGMALPIAQPQRVTATMLAEATSIISLGCDQDALPAVPRHWERWDDVPAPSQDLHGAYLCIEQHLAVWLQTIQRRSDHD